MAEYTVDSLLALVTSIQHKTPDARVRTIVNRIVSDLFRTIDELDIQPAEFWAAVDWLSEAGRNGELGLVTAGLGLDRLLDIRMDLADRAKGLAGGTPRAIEGPLYIAGAPESAGLARLDQEADEGSVLLMQGRVTDHRGQPIANATVDVWHANSKGRYSHFDDQQQPYNLRRRIRTDGNGEYRYRTLVPSGYGVPPGSATDRLMSALGRHGERPAHIHYMAYADGFQALTTQINLPGDQYLDDDFAFATRDELVVALEHHSDPAQIAAEGLDAPFYTSRFDIVLNPA
ncbi:Catechol 1,2-dioxygenase 2 [compost metagenome]